MKLREMLNYISYGTVVVVDTPDPNDPYGYLPLDCVIDWEADLDELDLELICEYLDNKVVAVTTLDEDCICITILMED